MKLFSKTDFYKLAYCCIHCDERCKRFRATINNDEEVLNKFACDWSEKENKTYSKEDVLCYGCRDEGNPANNKVSNCTVRICVNKKSLISCAHCDTLATCDKFLYMRHPEIREANLRLQKENELI